MKLINSYLTELKENLHKEKDGYFLHFKDFKPFKVKKTAIKENIPDKILILKCKNNIIFEYWINQKILIPPWETHWFQLKDNFLLKLKDDLLKDLIKKSIEKAGNVNRLCKSIKMSYPSFFNFINKNKIEMISIKKLKLLLGHLDISYAFLNDKIDYTKKGSKISIKNPMFPIDLSNKEGAHLLGHIVSDGCIYFDKKSRNQIRTKYSSEEESIDKFSSYMNKVFGKVLVSRERVRNCTTIRVGSSIIGESLLKVGAIAGQKAKIDGEVPWLIRYGDENLKRAYLQSVFEDEASVYYNPKKPSGSYIILSRYRHLKNLTNNQQKILIKLEEFMNSNNFPTGHANKSISIKKALENMETDRDLIQNIKTAPQLLLGESTILKETGIENRLFSRSLNKTHLGNYSLCFDLFINKKDSIRKFYKKIGFSLEHKQDKLLKIIGGEKNINAA